MYVCVRVSELLAAAIVVDQKGQALKNCERKEQLGEGASVEASESLISKTG